MENTNFVHPREYFTRGFFVDAKVNPELMGEYAKATANVLVKDQVPIPILENTYNQLMYFFGQEREFNSTEDLVDIMRSRVFVEPYIKYPFLIEFIESGLLSADSEKDIEVFFIHFHKIMDLCKYSKLEGITEY